MEAPMSIEEKIPSAGERALRLRGYLARQKWTLRREWSQQQEDAWWLLNELDLLLTMLQGIARGGGASFDAIPLVLKNHGRVTGNPRLDHQTPPTNIGL